MGHGLRVVGLGMDGDGIVGGVGLCEQTSRARHCSSLCLRTRLARKPNWRMRTNPEGSTWSRKRRMNSTASRVMVLVRAVVAHSLSSRS